MKKSIAKRFADFKMKHSLSTDTIIQMITEYANSDLEFARTYFGERYKISEGVFYKARDFAVICCLINTDTCKKVRDKAARNFKRNNPKNSSGKSLVHFNKLLVDREAFLNSFLDSDIEDIAHKYAEGLSVETISKAYDTGALAIKWLLRKGIVYFIIDADTLGIIRKKLGKKLDEIMNLREQNRERLIKCIDAEIRFLEMQIECYHLYFKNLQNKPTLEDLQKEILDANKRKEEILRW